MKSKLDSVWQNFANRYWVPHIWATYILPYWLCRNPWKCLNTSITKWENVLVSAHKFWFIPLLTPETVRNTVTISDYMHILNFLFNIHISPFQTGVLLLFSTEYVSVNVTWRYSSKYLLDKCYIHAVTQPLSASHFRWLLHLFSTF